AQGRRPAFQVVRAAETGPDAGVWSIGQTVYDCLSRHSVVAREQEYGARLADRAEQRQDALTEELARGLQSSSRTSAAQRQDADSVSDREACLGEVAERRRCGNRPVQEHPEEETVHPV